MQVINLDLGKKGFRHWTVPDDKLKLYKFNADPQSCYDYHFRFMSLCYTPGLMATALRLILLRMYWHQTKQQWQVERKKACWQLEVNPQPQGHLATIRTTSTPT